MPLPENLSPHLMSLYIDKFIALSTNVLRCVPTRQQIVLSLDCLTWQSFVVVECLLPFSKTITHKSAGGCRCEHFNRSRQRHFGFRITNRRQLARNVHKNTLKFSVSFRMEVELRLLIRCPGYPIRR